MAGPKFKSFAASIKSNSMNAITNHKKDLSVDEMALANYIQYYLITPLIDGVEGDYPTEKSVNDKIDSLIAKHFEKGSVCLEHFKKAKIGVSEDRKSKEIKAALIQFKDDYKSILQDAKTHELSAVAQTDKPFIRASANPSTKTKSTTVIGGRREVKRETETKPPAVPPRSGRPLPPIPLSSVTQNKPPNKPLPKDPIVTGKTPKKPTI